MIGIALGGNHSETSNHIHLAHQLFSEKITRLKLSRLFMTDPVGPGTRTFCNSVMVGESSSLSPEELLKCCFDIEKQCGRERSLEDPWSDRTLDLDLLFYHDIIRVSPTLILPHPQLHVRSFVLDPLCDIADQWAHPILKQSAKELQQILST